MRFPVNRLTINRVVAIWVFLVCFIVLWQARSTYQAQARSTMEQLAWVLSEESTDKDIEKYKAIARRMSKGPVRMGIITRELKWIYGNSRFAGPWLEGDLKLSLNTGYRVSGRAGPYEIIPFKQGLIYLETTPWSPTHALFAFWPLWMVLGFFTLLALRICKTAGYAYSEQAERCYKLFRKILGVEKDLPIPELLSRAQIKIQDMELEYQRKEEEISHLREELRSLRRALRKTSQDLRVTQQHLIQAGTLTALGEFAAGISHELNNPLGIVLGFAQHLLDEIPEDHPHYSKLKRIETELGRCQRILQDLLAFARPQDPCPRSVDINELAKDTVQFAFYPAVPGIEVSLNLEEGLPRVTVDPEQLEQVLLNLIKNGIQAMPEGGVIIISTKSIGLSQEDCFLLKAPELQPGTLLLEGSETVMSRRMPLVERACEPGDPAVQIDVQDTGVGIAQDDLQRIFTPFYTTKKRGTGLGLSICWKLIKRNGGILKVRSTLGKGTTFSIILPL